MHLIARFRRWCHQVCHAFDLMHPHCAVTWTFADANGVHKVLACSCGKVFFGSEEDQVAARKIIDEWQQRP